MFNNTVICREWDEPVLSVNSTRAGSWVVVSLHFTLFYFLFFHSQATSSRASGDLMDGRAERTNLSPGLDGSHYGATGGAGCPPVSQECCDRKDREEGCHNRGYQADEDNLE